MTSLATTPEAEAEELGRCFQEFVSLSCIGTRLTPEEKSHMTPTALSKLCSDCLSEEVLPIVDQLFPKFRERGKQTIGQTSFVKFLEECAYEFAKRKSKDGKIPRDDPSVEKYFVEFKDSVKVGSPNIQKVKDKVAGRLSS